MTLTKNETSILLNAVRQGIYFALLYAFVALLCAFSQHFREKIFHEHGVVENIQLSLLLGSGMIFAIHACCHKKWRIVSLLLASCCFLACCRELDKFFDDVTPLTSWKFGFMFPIAAFAYAIKHLKKTFKTLLKFVTTPSFFMMCSAIMVILPIAQYVGHRPFVSAVLGEDNLPAIKEFFEECCEAIGYFMIFVSSIEYCINTRTKHQ